MKRLETLIAVILILFSVSVSEGAKFNTAIIGTAPTGHVYANADTIYLDTDITGDLSIADEIRILQTSDSDSLNSHAEQFTIVTITSAYIELDKPWNHPTTTTAIVVPADIELVVFDENKLFALAIKDGVITIIDTYTAHIHIPASELGKNVTNPPVVNDYGICKVAEFTVNTDICYYKWLVPDNYASGDITIHINWTRSTTGSDESAKTVKWQVKNLVINGMNEEVASGENTDAIQDAYISSSTTDKICYKTDNMTIAAAEFSKGEIIIMEISAVTVDSGVALSEPALISLGINYMAYKMEQ